MSGLARDPIEQGFAAEVLREADAPHHDGLDSPIKEKEHYSSAVVSDDRDSVEELDPDGEVWVHPTDEEKEGPNALVRVVDKIPWGAYLIGTVEMAERLSYYGSTAVFTNYIQQPLPKGSHTGAGGAHKTSGALGLGQQASTGLTTFFQFWCYVVPLYGAYIADTHWGRYKTICWSVFVALVGHILLLISGLPGIIEHSHGAAACFSLAIIVMGAGTGGFKANISPLVAEQYRVTALRVKTLKNGQRVIVDPALTTSRIYMWFYLLINVGALAGSLAMTYSEKYVGYWLAFALPTVAFLLCPLVLYVGKDKYITSPPTGSVLANSLRIIRLCTKGTWSLNPRTTWAAWTAPGFWDKAKPSYIVAAGGTIPKWMTFDDIYVDEVRRGFKACQVFTFFPLYWLSYNQLNNNLTSQAATMQVGSVPNDVIGNLDPFALIIFIPLFAKFLYPFLERIGWRFTPIKKITLGFLTGTLAMIWSAVVQHYIYTTQPCGAYIDAQGCDPAPLSVWIQSGSYVLVAFSEIFASITGLEYAFTKAPKNMRSLVMSVFLFQSALSSAIGEAMNPLVEDPHLVWNYGSAAIISFVAGIAFWFCFRGLDREENALNELGTVPATKREAPRGFVTEKDHVA